MSPSKKCFAALPVAGILLLAACGGGSGSGGAPGVAGVSPEDGAARVSIHAVVAVRFTAAVDCASIEGAFTLTAAGRAIDGSVTCQGETIRFTPARALKAGVLHQAVLSTSARSSTGAALDAAYGWSFTTDPHLGGAIQGTQLTLASTVSTLAGHRRRRGRGQLPLPARRCERRDVALYSRRHSDPPSGDRHR